MPKKINKFLIWTPRILSVFLILFLVLMSLDIFDLGLDFWGTATGLFIHNIPAIILAVILAISWKHEIVGGVAFILAGLIYIGLLTYNTFEWHMAGWALTISGPAFLTGVLFLITWSQKKK